MAAGLGIALGLAGVLTWSAQPSQAAKLALADYEVGSYRIGGDFALTNQNGQTTGLRDFRGKVVVMFFGYTYCPDICPLTITEMGRLIKMLGADGKKVQPLLVTVDPERDTPERLKSYLTNFDPSVVALSGSERDIGQVAKAYRAKFAKRAPKGDTPYLVDHTAFVYVIDPQGKVRYLVPYDSGVDILAEAARHLLRG